MSDAITPPAPKVRKTRSGSEKRQRNHTARMRCTDDEWAQLQLNAERAGLSVNAFQRHQCLGTAGPRAMRRPVVERAALAGILAQLGKCGSNLNQIARVLNSGGDEPADIDAAIAEFRMCCARVAAALGRPFGGGDDITDEQAA